MQLSKVLMKILVCPVTKSSLIYDTETNELVSPTAALAYPIMDGIPILLADEAKAVNPERLKRLLEAKEVQEAQKANKDEDTLAGCY
jgi:uncharacterized protein YbaR (Trm112 family)